MGGGCDIDVIVQKEQKQSVVACRGVVFFVKLFAQVFHSYSSTPKYILGLQQLCRFSHSKSVALYLIKVPIHSKKRSTK